MTDLKAAVFTVLEGWALPLDARKILETAYYAQPEREWVGLTDKERNEMIGRIQHDQYTRQRDLIGKTQIITEMYLKERNT